MPNDSPQRRALPKSSSWRSKSYLQFVRDRPCSVTGLEGEEIVAHHVRCLGRGGIGLKPPDWMCVPITAKEHARLHDQGESSYWREHGLDPVHLVCMTMLVYLARHPSQELIEALAGIVET